MRSASDFRFSVTYKDKEKKRNVSIHHCSSLSAKQNLRRVKSDTILIYYYTQNISPSGCSSLNGLLMVDICDCTSIIYIAFSIVSLPSLVVVVVVVVVICRLTAASVDRTRILKQKADRRNY